MPRRAPRRTHTAIRLSPDALTRVQALADIETEGNTSAMLRKLLSEALRDRTAHPAPRDLTAEPVTDTP